MAAVSAPTTANEYITQWTPFLYRLANKYVNQTATNRRDAVEEMFNEIVVAILTYWSGYDPARGSFSNWAKMVAKSRFLKLCERQSQHLRAASFHSSGMKDNEDQDWAGVLADPNPVDVGGEIDRDDRRQAVRSALTQLTQIERDAVMNRYWSDDLQPDHFKLHLRRASDKLKVILADLNRNEEE